MKEAHLNLRRGDRGQTLPAIGFCLMVIMAFGGLAVDMGYLDYQHMRMQNATDDAALKGAMALIPNNCPNQTAANTAAQADASLDGFPAGAQINVSVHNPPQANDGPYAGVNCAVSVEINVPQTTTWFLKLFNAPTGMPITTQAVALMENNNPTCIFLLTPGIINTFTSSYINAPGCALETNGSGNGTFSGAKVAMSAIGYSNGSAPSGGTYPDATPTPMVPVADPCPKITGCAYIAANPPSSSSCTALTQSGGTISPGCYSNLTLSGAITLSPGTYVLTGTTTLTGSPGVTSLAGTGVTFYVTSSATAPNFAIAATGSLSAPTSGNYANVLYYQVPSNTTNPSFGLAGGLVNLSGLIYASGATNVSYCCTTGSVVLVFGGATFASISGEPSPPPNAVTIPTSSPMIANAVLVQ